MATESDNSAMCESPSGIVLNISNGGIKIREREGELGNVTSANGNNEDNNINTVADFAHYQRVRVYVWHR